MGDEIEINGHKVAVSAALHALAAFLLAKSESNYSVEHGGFRCEVALLPSPRATAVTDTADHECG